uniref:Uncharacterized protein n=1 Tax=Knipowitschia caucasica TaxID=637954 RepID=A0AAV2LFN8_KNICA
MLPSNCPPTQPREVGSLLPKHLWVSPDGGRGSGIESKQSFLSEGIKTPVHHTTDLQGAFVHMRMDVSVSGAAVLRSLCLEPPPQLQRLSPSRSLSLMVGVKVS